MCLFSKGNIEIQLDKNNFSKGDFVKGKVVLELKKNVKAKELFIKLIAKQKVRQGRAGNKSTKTQKIYNFKLDLDGEKEYPANQPLIYPFKIQIPKEKSSELAGSKMKKIANVAKFISNTHSRTDWYLIAKLKVPGIFNNTREKTQINVKEE